MARNDDSDILLAAQFPAITALWPGHPSAKNENHGTRSVPTTTRRTTAEPVSGWHQTLPATQCPAVRPSLQPALRGIHRPVAERFCR
jgi:hypothetical protein